MPIDQRGTVEPDTVAMPGRDGRALAETLAPGPSDPELQSEFAKRSPNSPAFCLFYHPGDLARVDAEH